MKTAVEWLDEQFKKVNHLTENEWIELFNKAKEMEKKQRKKDFVNGYKARAKEMEFQQRKKDFVNGYKARAKESNLIFDETSEMYAIKLFNETFKSE